MAKKNKRTVAQDSNSSETSEYVASPPTEKEARETRSTRSSRTRGAAAQVSVAPSSNVGMPARRRPEDALRESSSLLHTLEGPGQQSRSKNLQQTASSAEHFVGSTLVPSGSSSAEHFVGSTMLPSGSSRSGQQSRSNLQQTASSAGRNVGSAMQPSGSSRPAKAVEEGLTIPVADMDEQASIKRSEFPKKKKVGESLPPEPDWSAIADAFGEEGYAHILETALDYACDTNHRVADDIRNARENSSSDLWTDFAGNTLCSMHRDVVVELVSGNIAATFYESYQAAHEENEIPDEERATKSSFFSQIQELDKQGNKQACIYVRQLVDKHSQPPSVEQVRKLLLELRAYEMFARTGDTRASYIDSMYDEEWTEAMSKEGRRRYLETADGNVSFRRKVLRMFCLALDAHLNGKRNDEAFSPTFHYVGYAFCASDRKAQHAKTGSQTTNWLASLVMAIMNYQFPQDEFNMEFHVISLIGEEEQAAISEIVLAVIGHAYFWTGLGFNVSLCGGSVDSIKMKSYSDQRRAEVWEEWQKYIVEKTPWIENQEWDNDVGRAYDEKIRTASLTAKRTQLAHLKEQAAAYRKAYEKAQFSSDPKDQEFKLKAQEALKKLDEAERLCASRRKGK